MNYKIFICMFFSLTASLFAQKDSTEVERFGRRIQLDGFLMEWNPKDSRIWRDGTSFFWDAVNTPDGLAGYFKSESAVNDVDWSFMIIPQGDVEPLLMKNSADTSSANDFYRFDQNLLDSLKMVVCEWLIPWSRLGADSSGRYTFIASGWNESGDSLHPLLITGSKEKTQSVFSG